MNLFQTEGTKKPKELEPQKPLFSMLPQKVQVKSHENFRKKITINSRGESRDDPNLKRKYSIKL